VQNYIQPNQTSFVTNMKQLTSQFTKLTDENAKKMLKKIDTCVKNQTDTSKMMESIKRHHKRALKQMVDKLELEDVKFDLKEDVNEDELDVSLTHMKDEEQELLSQLFKHNEEMQDKLNLLNQECAKQIAIREKIKKRANVMSEVLDEKKSAFQELRSKVYDIEMEERRHNYISEEGKLMRIKFKVEENKKRMEEKEKEKENGNENENENKEKKSVIGVLLSCESNIEGLFKFDAVNEEKREESWTKIGKVCHLIKK